MFVAKHKSIQPIRVFENTKLRITSVVITLFLVGCAASPKPKPAQTTEAYQWQQAQLSQLTLAQNLTASPSVEDIAAALAPQLARKPFSSFSLVYAQQKHHPLWVNNPARLKALMQALGKADDHGLNRERYHWQLIQQLLPSKSAEDLARLDLIFSSAFTDFLEHIHNGRFEPREMEQRWYVTKEKIDANHALDLVANQEHSVENIVRQFAPPYAGYHQLHNQVKRYRKLIAAGGLPIFSSQRSFNPGSQAPQIAELRERLLLEPSVNAENIVIEEPAVSETNPAAVPRSHYFSQNLSDELRKVQKLYGVPVSGSLDKATIRALNVPAEARLKQILANMERYRWLPRHLGEHYALVDVAGFNMQIIRDGRREFSSPVIVGRADRSTPSFSDELRYIEFHPQWNLPNTVIYEDVIPAASRDSSYLTRRRIRVFDGWGADAVEVHPSEVDWQRYSRKSGQRLPYRLRQDAGKHNALGQVKYMFPNPFNVYLHDTPSKGLFNHHIRAFSSGCIRVKNIDSLTQYLFANTAPSLNSANTSPSGISKLMTSGQNQRVRLNQPLPIHIVYFTAKADASGSVEFRQDLYQRDQPLISAYDRDWSKPLPQLAKNNLPTTLNGPLNSLGVQR